MTATAEKTVNYLLVEDNNEHAHLIERCFRHGKLPSEIRRVHAGGECISYLEGRGMFSDHERYPYPDVVLLDIRMPGLINGLQTLQAIRFNPRHRALPVVMLTTSGRSADVRQAYELGANGYVIKSEDTTEMIEKLTDLQRSFATTNTLPERPTADSSCGAHEIDLATFPAGDRDACEKVDEHITFDAIVQAYENDPDRALRMLQVLDRIHSERFAALATRFCQEKRHLFASGREIDWVFIWTVVMKKLPRYLDRERMAGIVAGIVDELDNNEWASSNVASWYAWQGFCQAFLNRGVYSSTE